jgi:hypothetical protein
MARLPHRIAFEKRRKVATSSTPSGSGLLRPLPQAAPGRTLCRDRVGKAKPVHVGKRWVYSVKRKTTAEPRENPDRTMVDLD